MAFNSVMPPWLPIIEKSVFRFDASDSARRVAAPSVSFVNPRLRQEEIDIDDNEPKFEFIPVFETDIGIDQIVTLKLRFGTSFYGTGEVGGPLERTGKRIYPWNTDAWGYNQNTTSLYQSHPWVFAVLPNGQAFGVLADTTRHCEIDLRAESVIRIVAPAYFPVITFGPFDTPEELMISLGHAIGTTQMPPKWALGYHQCRSSYETAARVCEVAATFREKKIPCDVVLMDIDYMQDFKCFTFHKDRFPDPKELADELHSRGFKGIWMLDPGIHIDTGYAAYNNGSEEDVWVQTPDGMPYIGGCWPGKVVFPDYFNQKTRAWWAKHVKEFVAIGVDGICLDMNEPAVFKTVSKTMPDTNIHRGDEEVGGYQNHSHYHNVYGMFQARSTYEGMLLANANKRPFVLTRAAFIGAQRYAATWTGDNFADWEHLGMSIPMALNLGLSGQPLSGPNIGGFARDSNPKLFARWMGLGAMLPISRGHSEHGTIDQEPWSFDPEVEDLSRLALNRRYRMLPHFYTLFYKSHTTGVPVMTPIFFADPGDLKLRKIDDSFLLGPILVKALPLPKKKDPRADTPLPKGIWQQFHFNDDHPDLPMLFLKGGAIVPTGPVLQHVGEAKPNDTVTLLIALDDEGRAAGDLYEDDDDGFGFRTGDYLLTHYKAEKESSSSGKGVEVVIRVASAEGHRARPERMLHVRLLIGKDVQVEGECVDGEELRIRLPAQEEDPFNSVVLNLESDVSNSGGEEPRIHLPESRPQSSVRDATTDVLLSDSTRTHYESRGTPQTENHEVSLFSSMRQFLVGFLWTRFRSLGISCATEAALTQASSRIIRPGTLDVSREVLEMDDREATQIKVAIIDTPIDSTSVPSPCRLFHIRHADPLFHSYIRLDLVPGGHGWIKAEKINEVIQGNQEAGIRITRHTHDPADETERPRFEAVIRSRPGILEKLVELLKDHNPNYIFLTNNCQVYAESRVDAILRQAIEDEPVDDLVERERLEGKLGELNSKRRLKPIDLVRLLCGDEEAQKTVSRKITQLQQNSPENSCVRAVLEGVGRFVRNLPSDSSPPARGRGYSPPTASPRVPSARSVAHEARVFGFHDQTRLLLVFAAVFGLVLMFVLFRWL